MFIDKAKIALEAGNGGTGMSSFRREKFVARGGPNGGDGGRGANIIFIVDHNMNTLIDFRYRRKFKAPHGDNGQTSNMHGHGAEDLYVKVPIGTLVKDELTGQVIADLTEVGQSVVVAKGGRGGRGNARFVSSTHQAPTFSEKGEPGQQRNVVLELKLLADIGLVGYPSVGKSSILASVSAAKPEIAAYHFTTLVPVLGVVSLQEGASFVLADIPGLIEGANEGAGLGHEFLRHVERTKVLIHVLDVSGQEGRDPIADYEQINKELKLYSEKLSRRPQLIAANKMDLPESQDNIARVTAYLKQQGREIFPISAATGEGMQPLMWRAYQLLSEYVEEADTNLETVVYQAKPSDEVVISRTDDGAFIVSGPDLEKMVAMINFDNDEGLRRFQLTWRRLGLDDILKQKGIKEGNIVRISDMEFEYKE